jgi:hypothetical protein
MAAFLRAISMLCACADTTGGRVKNFGIAGGSGLKRLGDVAWLMPLLIIVLGMVLRLLVVGSVEHPPNSSFSTQQKITLNYAWADTQLPLEAGKWQPGAFFVDSLFRLKSDGVNFPELWRQLEHSNHPPLYYAFMHVLTVAVGGEPSFAPGLYFNLVVALATLVLVYGLCRQVFEDPMTANFALAVVAFSLATMSNLMFEKGYELLGFFVALQVYLFVRQMKSGRIAWWGWMLWFLACLGLFLTHYAGLRLHGSAAPDHCVALHCLGAESPSPCGLCRLDADRVRRSPRHLSAHDRRLFWNADVAGCSEAHYEPCLDGIRLWTPSP